MKLSLFMKLVAGYLVLIGAVSLLIPQAASGGMGNELSSFDIFVARTLGAALITLGIIDWSISNPAVLWANVFMNVTLAIVDTLNILAGTIGPSNWTGIGFHLAFTAGFLFYLLRPVRSGERWPGDAPGG
jgi:hypothetical protein